MNADEFYNNLMRYVDENDPRYATVMILQNMGQTLVNDRDAFIDALKESGIPAKRSMEDEELIYLYVMNLPENPKLKVATAYLVNAKYSSMDGVLNSKACNACKQALTRYWIDIPSPADAYYVNADGAGDLAGAAAGAASGGAVGAIATALGEGTKLYGKIFDYKHETSPQKLLEKKLEAQNALIKGRNDALSANSQITQKRMEESSKKLKYVVGGIVVVGIVIGAIILLRKKK